MPSGRIHDSITLWSLPLVAGLTFNQTQSSSLTLMLAGGYLFSGLMFGPDLDIYSRQYRRWGVLRWIWLPYQRSMRHRSFLSHGPIVGTVVRLFYLSLCCGIAAFGTLLLGTILAQLVSMGEQWRLLMQQTLEQSGGMVERSLQQNASEWIALILGLEAGAMSHALSDWTEYAYKRLIKKRLPSPKTVNPRSRSSNPNTSPSKESQPPSVQLPPLLPQSSVPRRRIIQFPDFKRPNRD